MCKPKEYWIRKGTNDFTYEFEDDNDITKTVKSLSQGDQFYDAVVDYEIEGGIHVIEYKEYARLKGILKEAFYEFEN